MIVEVLREIQFFAPDGSLETCPKGERCSTVERSRDGIRSRPEADRHLLQHDLDRGRGQTGLVWFVWRDRVRFGRIGEEVAPVMDSGLPEQHQGALPRGAPEWAFKVQETP